MVQGGKEFFKKRYESLGGKIVPVTRRQTIRVNTLKTSAKSLLNRLSSLGVKQEKVEFTKNGYSIVKSKFSVGAITEFLLGYYYIQGSAAQLPVAVLNPQPGDVVLDCCAAPGGKTTQLAQLMKNQGVILAFELRQHRMRSLVTNLDRAGVKNTLVFNGDISKAKRMDVKFDKVLLDAPCSGNYVSDDKWFEKRDFDGVKKSASIQRRLLRLSIDVLKPGGTLVYSTCSLEPEENELNMAWALDNLPVQLERFSLPIGDPGLTNVFGESPPKEIGFCKRFWPHKTNTEGFFIAKLIKNEA